MTERIAKKTVDEWLDDVDYDKLLNAADYKPSVFALDFMNFIKLVNGEAGESNKTPVVHLKMLDEIAGMKRRIANLCARGMAKTTLMFEYLVLYIAFHGGIEGFGEISGMIYVSDSMENGVKSARKNVEHRYYASEFLQKWIPKAKFTDNSMEFVNLDGHKLGVKMFGAKTGIRGTKIFGKRPQLAVMDDLVSDEDARSKAAMQTIRDTVYKGVLYALDPKKYKIVFNGTPFNKGDILYEAVESGEWHVNVWPICEKFPCTREEFRGAWEDRFSYDEIMDKYQLAVGTNEVSGFMQELMLRITSAEERLVQDSEIGWFSRQELLQNRNAFNFYITTDWAVSDKQAADFSVISVWAYNHNGDWFWVDGIKERQTIDKTFDNLFDLVARYEPQGVGVETTGQQGGFIALLQQEMMRRNCWFTFSSEIGKLDRMGIHPATNKLNRFNRVVPLFKAGKIRFPVEMKKSEIIQSFVQQIYSVTIDGIKAKNDDCLDTVSMLGYINAWKPSADFQLKSIEQGGYNPLSSGSDNASPQSDRRLERVGAAPFDRIEMWEEMVEREAANSGYASYIV